MGRVVRTSLAIAFVAYALVGDVGFLTHGDGTDADALADYNGAIPPLAKRLPRLPVAFAKFLGDSVKEYY